MSARQTSAGDLASAVMRQWLTLAFWPLSLAEAVFAAPVDRNVSPAARPAFRSSSGFAVTEVRSS